MLYLILMWLADRVVWLACFAECPRNPESVRISALRSMWLVQDSEINRLFGQKVRIMDDL